MIELTSTDFARVLPSFSDMKCNVPLNAVLEHHAFGRVFVDNPTEPETAFVWTRWGYFYLAGKPDNVQTNSALQQLLDRTLIPASVALGERGFILYPASDTWENQLEALLPGRFPIKIYRRSFTFQAALFEKNAGWRDRLPAGFTLHRINESMLASIGDDLDREILGTWDSIGCFLSTGFGYCLLDGNCLASVCTSAFVASGMAEISVTTGEKYRQRGLATLATSALLEHCLSNHLTPRWECFWDNRPSLALAQKLGFEFAEDHPVYYWEEKATP